MKNLWKKLTRIWKKSSPTPSRGQLVRTGYAVLVKDKLSSALVWYTFPGGSEEAVPLDPNESIILRPNTFRAGTRIDIYEIYEGTK